MGSAWENGTEGYVGTVKRILTEPAGFFREIDTEAPIGRAVLFAVISFAIAGVGQAIWNAVGSSLQMLPMIAENDGQSGGALAAAGFGVVAQVVISLLMPLWGLMGAFVGGGITHLFLLLFGAGQKGYMTTVRANLYGSATGVIYLVPCCGALVASIWTLVITIVGLTEMHQSTTGRVLAAVFAPVVLCCVCIGLAVGIAFLVGGAAAFSQFPHMPWR